MKLNVPYYSQYLNVTDPFWMLRSCGAICFKMVTEYYGKDASNIVSFCNEARDKGGYDINNGWVHDYLVIKLLEMGLKAERKEGLVGIDEIITSLDAGNPVIVSVEKRVLEQTRFHIIVVVGHEDNNIFYHEPESTDKIRGAYRRCNTETFINYWRGKAIFISK
jgi:uncharacterized protein YvpB